MGESSQRDPAIEVSGLTKRYGRAVALNGIDLAVPRAAIFALLGPNGAGKSTLFSILALLRAPSGGSARVLGHDVVSERDRIRKQIGIVFQEPAIEQRLTGRKNLRLMGVLFGLPPKVAVKRAEDVMSQMGILPLADRPTATLSGGERRKLELARALMTDPDVLFLDEATVGLDVEARRAFWTNLKRLPDRGKTVFFTSHYIEEAELADHVAVVDRGRIIHQGTPAQLKDSLGGCRVRLETRQPLQLGAWLAEKGIEGQTHADAVTFVRADGRRLVPEILRHTPIEVLACEMEALKLDEVVLALMRSKGRGDGADDAERKLEAAPC